MRLNAAAKRGLTPAGAGVLVPALEAVPAELVRSADLVRKPVRVEPSLLLGPPTTVPRELEEARVAGALYDHRTHEIRAPRPCVDVQPLDGELRVRMEQLVDEPYHLDPRDVAGQGDSGDLSAGSERDDVGFEPGRRARARQQLGVDGHGRNIQMSRPRAGSAGLDTRTKLTAESARPRQSCRSQW